MVALGGLLRHCGGDPALLAKIASEMVCTYPPGIPIIVHGERQSEAIIEYLQQVTAPGAMIDGVVDQSLSEVRILLVTPGCCHR